MQGGGVSEGPVRVFGERACGGAEDGPSVLVEGLIGKLESMCGHSYALVCIKDDNEIRGDIQGLLGEWWNLCEWRK